MTGPLDPPPGPYRIPFRVVDATEDPLPAHRPPQIDCPPTSYSFVYSGLDVETGETGRCNYLSVAQPSLYAMHPGDTLHLFVQHGRLLSIAAQPAQAHVALLIGQSVLWEKTIAIPSEFQFYEETLRIDGDVPAGTPVYFHLHNHGDNAWLFSLLDLTTP